MKIEKALKKSAKVGKTFHTIRASGLLTSLRTEFRKGNDVHGKKFEKLSAKYKKQKRKMGRPAKADMILTGKFVSSGYFGKVKVGKNSWRTTTGNTLEGTKALAHSGKIKRPKGLPIRAIVGSKAKDNVVHPKIKKKFIEAYSKRIFGTFRNIPKKEFL